MSAGFHQLAKRMAEKQQELAKAVMEDPAVESISSFIGADGTNITTNSTYVHQLETAR